MRVTLVLGLLAGCYDGFETREGQLELEPVDLVVGPYEGFTPDHPMIVGAELCADVRCGDGQTTCPGDELVDACFATSASGALASTAPDCVEAVAEGAGDWAFDPVPCDANADGYAPVADGVDVVVVGPELVEARLDPWVEDLVHEDGVIPMGGGFPDDWTPAAGEPFQVVEGGHLRLPITLWHPDHEVAVAWTDARATVEIAATGGAVPTVDRPAPGWVQLEAEPGAAGELRFSVATASWTVAEVVGVPDDPGSVELVVAFVDEGGGKASPLGARAVVRDRDGALVFGTPVTWVLLEGDLAIEPGGDLPGDDYALLRDACLPPSERGGERTAVLEVRHGDLVSTVELAWTAPVGDGADDAFADDPFCHHGGGGCGCQTAPAGAAWLGGLLGVLALVRRRAAPGDHQAST